jgi:hypothetical protein
LRNIKHVNHKEKTVTMVNDEIALVTAKKLRPLVNAMAERAVL